MADDDDQSGYETAAYTPRPRSTKSGRFFGEDDAASGAGDGDFKAGDSATGSGKKKKPARMRRFTQAAMPQLWKRAENARSQMRNRDATSNYLQEDLRAKIAAMNDSVAEADRNLRNSVGGRPRRGSGESYGDGDGDGEGGWDNGGGSDGWGSEEDAPEPEIDPSRIRIDDGPLVLKDRSRGLLSGRKWRNYFCRLNGQYLDFYKNRDDFDPAHRLHINHESSVERGDPNIKHKNANVKYDFDVLGSDGVTYHIYAEDEDDTLNWIDTINHIIDACIRAQNAPRGRRRDDDDPYAAGIKPKLAPEEEEAARDEAIKHQAYGPGLFEATRGETAYFTVQAYDDFDNPKTYGGDPFKVSFENEELHFDITPRDNGDGTYTVFYCPTRVGDFELSISLNDFDIYGSPFHPIVHPAPTSGMHCVVIGDGAGIADAGKTNEFTIVARDQFDGERGVGGDNFEVSIDGPATLHPVVDCGNGRYTVKYDLNVSPATLAQTGLPTLTLHVMLNNEGYAFPRPVVGSPFNPRVRLPLQTFAEAQAVSAMAPHQREAALAQAQAESASRAAAAAQVHTPSRLAALLSQPASAPTPPQAAASPYGTATPPRVPAPQPGRGAGLSDAHLQATLNVMRRAQAVLASSPAPGGVASPYAQHAATTPYASPAPPAVSHTESPLPAARPVSAVGAGPGPSPAGNDDLSAREAALAAQMAAIQAERRALEQQRAEVESRAQQVAAQAAARTPATASGRASSPAPAPSSNTNGYNGGFLQSPPPARSAQPVAPPSPAPSHESPKRSSAPSDQSGGVPTSTPLPADGAPPELFEPGVVAMFDKYRRSLFALYQYYCGDAGGLKQSRFIALARDYDLCPTFLSRRELRGIYGAVAVARGFERPSAAVLDYGGFIEALGRVALFSLSKAAFARLYPTPTSKVVVLLEMWSMADPRKLAEVKSAHQANASSKSSQAAMDMAAHAADSGAGGR